MRTYSLLLLALTFLSCKQDVEDIQLLNGYWEIEKVEFNTGERKDYSTNQTLEHFVIDADLVGYRAKVKPLLDGTFEVIADGEIIQVSKEDDRWIINYQTSFSDWIETIEKLDDTHLELHNEDNKTYIYKRYNPEPKS